MRTEYDSHIKRKNAAYKAKNECKLRMLKDKNFISLTFYLQSVLPLKLLKSTTVENLCIQLYLSLIHI